ncbi:MAG: F0F1 ATP synthase subunit delta [Elusimicrobiales bacterium]
MKAQDRILAGRYGKAYITACGADARAGLDELSLLHAELAPALEYLNNPLIPAADKKTILSRAAAGREASRAYALAAALLDARRFYLLDAIMARASDYCDRREGIMAAGITYASAPDGAQTARLAAGLEKLSGARARVSVSRDGALIAGFSARMGDILVDGSARGALARLKTDLQKL